MATKAGRRYVAPHLRGDVVEAIKMDDDSITKVVRSSTSAVSSGTSGSRSGRYQNNNGYPGANHTTSYPTSMTETQSQYYAPTMSGRYPMSASAASAVSTGAPPGLRPGPAAVAVTSSTAIRSRGRGRQSGGSRTASSPYSGTGSSSSSTMGSTTTGVSSDQPPQRQYVRRSHNNNNSNPSANSVSAAVQRHSQSPSVRFSQSPTQSVDSKKKDRTLGDWRRTPKTEAVSHDAVDSLTEALPSLDLSADSGGTGGVSKADAARAKPKSHRFGQMFPADDRPRSPQSIVSETRSQPGRSTSSPGAPHHSSPYAGTHTKTKRSSSPSRSISSDRVMPQSHVRRGRSSGSTSADTLSLDKSYPRSATESPLYGPYSALSGQLKDKPTSPMKLDSPTIYKHSSESSTGGTIASPGRQIKVNSDAHIRSAGVSRVTGYPPGRPVSQHSSRPAATSAVVVSDPAIVSVVSVQPGVKSVRSSVGDRASATPPGIGFQRYARKYDNSISRSPQNGGSTGKRAISPLTTAVTPSGSSRRGRRGRGAASATSPLSAPLKGMVSLSPMSAVEPTIQPSQPVKVVKPPPVVDDTRGRDKKPPPNWAKGLIPKKPRVPESSVRSRPRKPPIRSESEKGSMSSTVGSAGMNPGITRERLPHSETPGSTPTSFYPPQSYGRPPTVTKSGGISQGGWSGVSRYGIRSDPADYTSKTPGAKKRITAELLSHVLFVSYVKDPSKVADMLKTFAMNHTHIFVIPNGHLFVSFRSQTYAQSILKRFSHDFLRFANVDPADYVEVYKRAPKAISKASSPASSVSAAMSGRPPSSHPSAGHYYAAEGYQSTPDRNSSRVKVNTAVARRMIDHHLGSSSSASQSHRQQQPLHSHRYS